MILKKNVDGQIISFFVWNAATGAPETGDAANITAYVKNDDGAAASFQSGANPTEEDDTNMPGYYYFEPTQAETNYDQIVLYPKSTTADVVIMPVFISTLSPLEGKLFGRVS